MKSVCSTLLNKNGAQIDDSLASCGQTNGVRLQDLATALRLAKPDLE